MTSTITSVSVTPSSISIECSGVQQFNANVQGTGSYSHVVTWSVNNVASGNANVGTIDANGKYTAPATVPTPADVTIRATSTADSSKVGSAAATVKVSPTISAVTLSPASNTVVVGRSIDLNITVTGTGNFLSSVKVYVNDVENGNATLGYFTTAGHYTAPAQVPGVPLTLKAVSVADPSKSATAIVEVLAASAVRVSISPSDTLALHWGGTQQFTATVTGTANSAVTWIAAVGSVTSTGLYTAPSDSCCGDSVTAVSVADPSASAIKGVNIIPDAPKILSIAPDHATTGDYIHINTQYMFASNEVPVHLYFTGPGGLPLHLYVPGLNALNNQISTVIPLGVQTGPLSLEIRYPYAPPLRSDPVMFTRIPQLRIEPELRELSSRESTTFHKVLLAADTPSTVSWSADQGSIDANGVYTAPLVSADTLAKITACVESTTVCQTARIRVHPLRLDPFRGLVQAGGNISLKAVQSGSPVAANWKLLAPSGTLSSTGDYTAGTTALDGGNIAILPEYPGTSEIGFLGVTGKQPGEISRIYDHLALPYGDTAYFDNAIATGNKLFVITSDANQFYTSQTHIRLDVYDMSDPSHPVFKSSVEPPLHPGRMWIEGNMLWMETWMDFREDYSSIVAGYDISGWTPQIALLQKPLYGPGALNGRNIAWCDQNSGEPNTIYCAEYSIDSASFTYFQLPKPAGVFISSTNTLRFGNRLQLMFSEPGVGFHITTYDVSTTPATYQHDSIWPLPAGAEVDQLAFVSGTRVGIGPFLIDCSTEFPTVLSTLPVGRILDFNSKHLLGAVQGSLRVFDITDPAAPVRLTELPLDTGAGGIPIQPKLAGDKVLAPAGPYGLVIFDISAPGGPLEKQMVGHTTSKVFDQVLRNNVLYSGEILLYQMPGGSALEVWDVSQIPARELKSVSLGTEIPYATALSGNTLFVGTDTAIHIFDVTSAGNPTEIKSMPANVRALSVTGTLLFASTMTSGNVGVLTVFDISNAATPVKIGELYLPSIPIKLAVAGNVLYAAADSAGLLGIDISTPASPKLMMQWQPVPYIEDITVDGSLLLLAGGDKGLLIADAASPFAPQLLSQTPIPNVPASISGALDFPNAKPWALATAIHGGFAYVGTGKFGARLYIFDYRNTAQPRIVGNSRNISTGSNFISSIVFNGNDVIYAGSNDAVFPPAIQADITNPANVILLYPYLLESAVSNMPPNAGTSARTSTPGSPKLQPLKPR